MKKVLLFLMGLVLVAPAFASVRTEGMGILPQQDEDIDLIWLFPEMASQYSVVDYRFESRYTTQDDWGGMIHTDKYIGNWGLYLGRPFQNGYNFGVDYVDAQYLSIFSGAGSWYDRVYNWNNFNGTAYAYSDMWWTPAGQDYRQMENKFDLFKTFKLGNGTLGLQLNYAQEKNRSGYSYDDTGNPTANDKQDQGFGSHAFTGRVGYGMADVGPLKALDFSVGFGIGKINDYDTDYDLAAGALYKSETEKFSDDGIHELSVNVRSVKEMGENTNMVTNLGFMSNKLGVKYEYTYDNNGDGVSGDAAGDNYTDKAESKVTSISFSNSCVHKVHDGAGKVVGGLNLNYGKMKSTHSEMYNLAGQVAPTQLYGTNYEGETSEYSLLTLWANVGVEANVLKWLQFRGGFSHQLAGVSKETSVYPYNFVANAYTQSYTTKTVWNDTNPTILTFGTGVVYKNFNVDLLFSSSDIQNLLGSPSIGDGVFYDNNGSLLGLDAAKVQVTYNL